MRIFNSRDNECKSPFGSVREGENIHFKITIPRYLGCSSAILALKDDLSGDTVSYSMFWCGMPDENNEQWELDLSNISTGLYWYHFSLDTKQGRKYIMRGWGGEGYFSQTDNDPRYQLLCYDKDFQTPSWLPGGIMYQIFPDRFYFSGEKKEGIYPDKKLHDEWYKIPDWRPDENGIVTNSDFFQGDLKGITEKLDYLQELGVNCIYLNPIFEAYSNHRYDTGDYEKIDPVLGTEEDFKELCSEAKKRGMYIINDGVFSHTGSDSKYFNRQGRYPQNGAYNSKNSPYYTWYKFMDWPNIYHSWWGFDTLPEVEELSYSFDRYINGENGIIRKWMKCGNSGWRLDVADELPDPFIQHIREAIKVENPDALLLGEVWEDASIKESYSSRRRFLYGKQLDSVMNYPFRDAILGFLDCGDGRDMVEMITCILENYPRPVVRCLMNLLGTHDTERVITLLAGERQNGRGREWQANTSLTPSQREYGLKRMRLASGIQFTLPGVPCIYYGDEAGVEGYKDPFNRAPFPWGKEDKGLTEWYKQLAKLRSYCSCLKDGDFKEFGSYERTMGYIRYDDTDELLCVFNAATFPIDFIVPKEFEDGEALLGTILNGRDLEIPANSCAFVKISADKKHISEEPENNEVIPEPAD